MSRVPCITPAESPVSHRAAWAQALENVDAALAAAARCLENAERAHAIADALHCLDVAVVQVAAARAALLARKAKALER